jgi:hypothetical protein
MRLAKDELVGKTAADHKPVAVPASRREAL